MEENKKAEEAESPCFCIAGNTVYSFSIDKDGQVVKHEYHVKPLPYKSPYPKLFR